MIKAQIKMQQTAFMLLALVLFFALIFVFYFILQSRNLNITANQLEMNRVGEFAKFIAGTTEFACAGEQYCVDSDKIMVLKNMTSYNNYWQVSFIDIVKINGTDRECNFETYPDCNVIHVYDNKKATTKDAPRGSFISLCRHEKVEGYNQNYCELAKLIIGYVVK